MTLGQNLLESRLLLVRRFRHCLLILKLAPRPKKSFNISWIIVFVLFTHLLRFRRLENRLAVCVVGRLQITDKRSAIGNLPVNGRVKGEAIRVEGASLVFKVECGNVSLFDESRKCILWCSHLFGEKWVFRAADGCKEFFVLGVVHQFLGTGIDGSGNSTGAL